jgi:peptide deformylase
VPRILEIITYPADILSEETQEVTPGELKSGKFNELIADMIHTCASSYGLGLSANQVGVNKRIFVYRPPGNRDNDPNYGFTPVINPIVRERSGKMTSKGEGCLSIPGVRFRVPRYKRIVVTAHDPEGSVYTITTKSKNVAKIMQHEIDHLDGISLYDIGKIES